MTTQNWKNKAMDRYYEILAELRKLEKTPIWFLEGVSFFSDQIEISMGKKGTDPAHSYDADIGNDYYGEILNYSKEAMTKLDKVRNQILASNEMGIEQCGKQILEEYRAVSAEAKALGIPQMGWFDSSKIAETPTYLSIGGIKIMYRDDFVEYGTSYIRQLMEKSKLLETARKEVEKNIESIKVAVKELGKNLNREVKLECEVKYVMPDDIDEKTMKQIWWYRADSYLESKELQEDSWTPILLYRVKIPCELYYNADIRHTFADFVQVTANKDEKELILEIQERMREMRVRTENLIVRDIKEASYERAYAVKYYNDMMSKIPEKYKTEAWMRNENIIFDDEAIKYKDKDGTHTIAGYCMSWSVDIRQKVVENAFKNIGINYGDWKNRFAGVDIDTMIEAKKIDDFICANRIQEAYKIVDNLVQRTNPEKEVIVTGKTGKISIKESLKNASKESQKHIQDEAEKNYIER